MRRKVNVATEMSLHVLAFNLKLVIRILGTANQINAMRLAGAKAAFLFAISLTYACSWRRLRTNRRS
jgi:hypothetical protein